MTVTTIVAATAWILLSLGGLLLIISAIGLVRMPDLYTRMHAAGLIDTLGLLLALGGLALQAEFGAITLRLALIAFFVLITAPVAIHSLCLVARHHQAEEKKQDHI